MNSDVYLKCDEGAGINQHRSMAKENERNQAARKMKKAYRNKHQRSAARMAYQWRMAKSIAA